jgi:hypothetical protein
VKPKTIAMTLALSTGFLVTGAVAQHAEGHSDQTFPPADKNKMMLLGKMPQMMTTQQEISTLADQLLKTFPAIENEKDPVVLQKKLAEHRALLKELQTELLGQSQMMEKMRGQMMMMGHMMGSMMGDEQKKP